MSFHISLPMPWQLSFILVFASISITSSTATSLIKCKVFIDNRNINRSSNFLIIPANLSSRGEVEDKQLRFGLKTGTLSCQKDVAILQEIKWEGGKMQTPNNSIDPTGWLRDFRNFFAFPQQALKSIPVHFTPNGHFLGNKKYFHSPNGGYCVKSLENFSISLLICPPKCGSGGKGSICVPKCCALDEAFDRGRCIKLNKPSYKDGTYWKPEVYQEGGKQIDENTRTFQFFEETLLKNCNRNTQAENHKEALSVYRSQSPAEKLRLSVNQDGRVEPVYFDVGKRNWEVQPTEKYCIEADIPSPSPFEGDDYEDGPPERISSASSSLVSNATLLPDYYAIIFCSPPPAMDNKKNVVFKSWTYIIFALISVPFLIATVVVYLMLIDRLNLHSLTILAYSICDLLMYSLTLGAQLIFIVDSPQVLEWVGIRRRGWPCYLLAIFAHFFSLSRYTWLTVMNFDLWMLFKSPRPARKKNSKGEWKTLLLYSVMGWVVPLLIIASFIVVDEVYRDPKSGVPVPDYAVNTCFVNPYFRDYYVHIPIAIILIFNLILIFLTMKFFWRVRRKTQATLSRSDAQLNRSNKYSAKLFAKLFVVMGGVSLVDFVASSCYRKYQDDKPWIVVIVESLTYLVPVFLFGLFCLNEQILGQLEEKFPSISGHLKPFRKALGLEKDRAIKKEISTTEVTKL